MGDREQGDPRVIGERYRLGRLLGRGSMGTVWAAHDEVLRRDVAVKEVLLPPGMPEGAAMEQRERAMREARAIAALSHPNVVTVHDVVREDGEPFVVMELVASISLASLIAEHGPLDQPRAAVVADAVAAALQAAHRRGITHRDVKPGNVLLGEDGLVKLTDFGLARSVSEATMTHAGLMLGTPAYIAPELARGRPTTPAADLWELGATLYAAVEGRPPYNVDDDPLNTVHEVVHGEVPSLGGIGPLYAVIAGLMVKDPAARMPLAEVRALVRPVLPDPGQQLWDIPGAPGETGAPSGDSGRGGSVGGASSASGPAQLASDPGPLPFGSASGSPALAPDPGPLPFAVPESGSAVAPGASGPGPLPFAVPDSGPAAAPGALASGPGPLPFAVSGSGPLTKSRRRPRVLWVAAAVVAVAALTVGGIVAFRPAGENEKAAAPATTPVSKPSATSAPTVGVVDHAGTMKITGEPDKAFTIKVPETWAEFHDPDAGGGPPPEGLVNYVSPDARQEIRVERVAGYFDTASRTQDYVHNLLSLPVVAEEGTRMTPVGQSSPATVDAFYYDRDLGSAPGRCTKLRALPHGQDLWTVAITIPVAHEADLAQLFDQVAGTFKPAD